MVDKILDNVGRAFSVDLLAAGEGKINVVFRLEALGDQIIGGGKDAVEGDLGIQGTPAPENTVLQNGSEGRLFPVLLVDRHHIVVGHEDSGISVGFSGPPQQQRPVRQLPDGADIENPGIEARQQGDQLVKFSRIFQSRVIVGYGFAAHQLSQSIHSGLFVKGNGVPGQLRLGLGRKSQGTQQNHQG